MKRLASIVLLALVAPAAFAFQTAPDDATESDQAWLSEQRRINQRFVELFRERRYAEGEELARSLLLRGRGELRLRCHGTSRSAHQPGDGATGAGAL